MTANHGCLEGDSVAEEGGGQAGGRPEAQHETENETDVPPACRDHGGIMDGDEEKTGGGRVKAEKEGEESSQMSEFSEQDLGAQKAAKAKEEDAGEDGLRALEGGLKGDGSRGGGGEGGDHNRSRSGRGGGTKDENDVMCKEGRQVQKDSKKSVHGNDVVEEEELLGHTEAEPEGGSGGGEAREDLAFSFGGMDLIRTPSLKSLPPPLPLFYDRGHTLPPPSPLSSACNPDPRLGPSNEMLRRLLHWELTHPLDEGGTAKLTVKQSSFPGGGVGCFATQRPAPVEYVRDQTMPREGFLTQEESDTQWEDKAEGSTFIMEVTLGADWFRDEVEGGGKLRPMQDLHRYVWQGRMSQQLRWDEGSCQYVLLDKSERALYKGWLDPDANAAPFMNDALFGKHDGDSDEYEAEDELLNAFTMVPCLRSSPAGGNKVELSSVWYYPRVGWHWSTCEQEVTCGYHWPLEEWMRPAADDAGPAPAVPLADPAAAAEATAVRAQP